MIGSGLFVTANGNNAILSKFSSDKSQQWRFFLPPSPPGRLSQWTVPFQLPLVAIAATHVAGGRILVWSSSQLDNFATGQLRTFSAIYDTASGAVTQDLITSLQADMFCPGIATLPDGSILVVGGVTSGATNIYNGSAWSRAARLNIRRGYNSAVTLSSGGVLTLGGSWAGGYGNKGGELWTAATGWRLLPQVKADTFLTADSGGIYRQDSHMWLFAAGGGWVFHAGPSKGMHWVSTAGDGAVVYAGRRGDDGDAMNGVAVLYDVGKVLTAGGAPDYVGGTPTANAFVIDVSAGPGAAPAVRRTGPMGAARAFHTAVALPSGEVVVVGGMGGPTQPFQDARAVLWAEVWSPDTERFAALTWAPGAAPMCAPRGYHSVALLLPDGRVLSSGGGACGPYCPYNHFDAQILTPPYLLNPDGSPADRPALLSAPAEARLGGEALVEAAGAAAFALVRTSSTTHAVNTDQRRVPLAATLVAVQTDGGGALPPGGGGGGSGAAVYSLAIPADPGTAVPGPYWLFALGPTGTPSVSLPVLIRAAAAGN